MWDVVFKKDLLSENENPTILQGVPCNIRSAVYDILAAVCQKFPSLYKNCNYTNTRNSHITFQFPSRGKF
jgi:hypothetical protein